MDPTALVLTFVELLNKVDQQLLRKTSPLYKIGKFRHLLAYIGRFVFPIREPGRLYQNRESPGEIGRLERYGIVIIIHRPINHQLKFVIFIMIENQKSHLYKYLHVTLMDLVTSFHICHSIVQNERFFTGLKFIKQAESRNNISKIMPS